MRTLLLFRGAPGCGKSTFIDAHNLRQYALSADDIRMLCQSPQQTVDGSVQIGMSNEREVWDMLYRLLEIRMRHGEFTVIDATNSKATEINKYKELCSKYRYRIMCVDMTDLPIEECKKRNSGRVPLKRVPDEVIDKMYARFRTQKIPSGIKVIKDESEYDSVFMHKFDMSQYEKIVHVGDAHGCNTALMEYFKDGLNDNYFYIFVGDYIDRGIENAEVVKFLLSIYDKKNVLLLEGNHDHSLFKYGNDEISPSKEFEFVTKKQLKAAELDKKELRQLYRKFGQCAWYTYGDKEVFVTHAGLATMPENVSLLATEQMIRGVGKYEDSDTIADTWMNTTSDNMYQIHGHRNIKALPIKSRDRVFNLEGKVEFGGCLRIVELDKDGFHEIEIKNDVFKSATEIAHEKQMFDSPVSDIVLDMRNSKFVQEKEFGNISSFNFTRDAFYDKVWNAQTVKARGLFIDTDKMTVFCRSFNKFFNINENELTRLGTLERTMQFPITLYVKENGFLGMVTYSEYTDDLVFATKSSLDGHYVEWLKEMFYKKVKDAEKAKQICKDNNVTLVFECVDMENDPHIIEYKESELFLLTAVKNQIDFEQFDYANIVRVASEIGVKTKEKAFEIATWAEFIDLYNAVNDPDYLYDGRVIEGFVVEDSNGFMTKMKLDYYNFWKKMRSVAQTTLRKGYIDKTSILADALSNDFYGYLRELYRVTTDRLNHNANLVLSGEEPVDYSDQEIPYSNPNNIPRDIISLRNMFYADKMKYPNKSYI